MRVALVHDYLNQYGGAERVLEAFCEIWPEAPIFTLVYDAERTGRAFEGRKIRTSFLQRVPLAIKHHRSFLMLMPWAVESFDLGKYDLIVSDSASFAKGVIAAPDSLHVCYCHTPTRYVWDDSQKYLEEFNYPSIVKKIVPPLLNYLRVWDGAASERPAKYIANSRFVASRIKKYHRREADVIHPPVGTSSFFISNEIDDYFLMVARFLPYKKVDLAVRVFNELGWPLKIIGDGPEKNNLKKNAHSNIEFIGLISEKNLPGYYSRCRALIFPQEEDFGIAAVEAMSSGRPVVAFAGGGALEMVREGETGIFFKEQTVESLKDALLNFKQNEFDPLRIKRRAADFDKEVFKEKIKNFIKKTI